MKNNEKAQAEENAVDPKNSISWNHGGKDIDNNEHGLDTSKPSFTHKEIEIFANWMCRELGCSADSIKGLYSACYSGIELFKLEQMTLSAKENGKFPIKLFWHLVKQTEEWKEYKQKKSFETNDSPSIKDSIPSAFDVDNLNMSTELDNIGF